MLPSSFLTLLHDGVRHIIDKDANLYVWLRHEILMKYDVVIWVKYNYDSKLKNKFCVCPCQYNGFVKKTIKKHWAACYPCSVFCVVDRGIEPLCQDWESCILTIRWIHHVRALLRIMRKLGDSNPRYVKHVRQFSKLLVSATHPNFHTG